MPTQRQLLRAAVVDKRGRSCAYCGVGPLHRHALHLDRIDPAGAECVANLVPCCATCRQLKGDTPAPVYIAARIPMLRRELAIMQALAERLR